MFKHTKKLISTALTTALIVSAFPAAGFAQDAAVKNEVVVTDDFQSYLHCPTAMTEVRKETPGRLSSRKTATSIMP